MKKTLEPVQVLRKALAERSAKNPRFSLRAFAKATGISHTVLSLVLSGKRPLSQKAAQKLAAYLNLNPTQRDALMRNYQGIEHSYETLPLDAFEVISDWYHYAILSALELPNAKFEARWLAKQLGVQILQVKLAMERLQRLGLVQKMEDGVWRQASAPLKIDNTLSTAATKKFHKQILERAAQSIDKDPITDRDFSSMTFAMDPSLVEFARQKIRQFRRELTAELEKKSTPGAVFNFTIQLYPVTQISKEKI